MKRTDATFNFQNNSSIILALYYFEFWGESIIKRSTVDGSMPMISTRAYYHKSIIQSMPFSVILLCSMGQKNSTLYFLESMIVLKSFPKYTLLGVATSFQEITCGYPATVGIMIEGQSIPERPIFTDSVPLSMIISSLTST